MTRSEKTVVQPAAAEARDVVGRRLLWFCVALAAVGVMALALAFLVASAEARSSRAELDRLSSHIEPAENANPRSGTANQHYER